MDLSDQAPRPAALQRRWRAGRLHDEHVGATHAFEVLDVDLAKDADLGIVLALGFDRVEVGDRLLQLVEDMRSDYWKQCGAVMMPIRCDTAWGQPARPRAHGQISLPPNHIDVVGQIEFVLTDLQNLFTESVAQLSCDRYRPQRGLPGISSTAGDIIAHSVMIRTEQQHGRRNPGLRQQLTSYSA